MYNLFNDSNIAAKKLFVGREDEMKRLSSDFIFLTNTAVLAPRGYGKSSLIRVAAQEAFRKEKNLRFCFVDLSNVRNEEVFFELLAQGVLKAVSSGPEEVVENVKRFFPHTSPKISFDASGSFYVDIDWNEVRQNSEELLLIFDVVKLRARTTASSKKFVTDWFVAQFPNYRDSANIDNSNTIAFPVAIPNTADYKPKEA